MSVGTTILLLQTRDAAPLQTGRSRTLTTPPGPHRYRGAVLQCWCKLVLNTASYIHTLHTMLVVIKLLHSKEK